MAIVLDSLHQVLQLAQDAADLQPALPQIVAWVSTGLPVPDDQVWQLLHAHLSPSTPFPVHQQLMRAVYAQWPKDALGPPALWMPSAQQAADTNVMRQLDVFAGNPDLPLPGLLSRSLGPSRAWQLLLWLSCLPSEAFWSDLLFRCLQLQLHTQPSRILSMHPTDPDQCQWLPGARLNIAHAALTSPLHPEDKPALLWATEGAPAVLHSLSLAELRSRALHVAACARQLFKPGDAVAIDMPMSAASVAVYLGLVLAGCAVVSIADSFAAVEIESRLRIAGAKGIFTQDVVIRGGKALPLYARVVEAHAPTAIVLPATGDNLCDPVSLQQCSRQRLQVQLRPGDLSWQQFLGSSLADSSDFQPHVADGNEVTNILFSSGTTGEPKAIPWTHLTPLRCAVDGWSLQDIQPGQRVCWPTNLGWMMGPWLIYAALLNGATVTLYEGAPLGRDFGEFVAAAGVHVLGVVPSIVKTWRASGCMEGLCWDSIRCFSSTGEASAPEDVHWLSSRVRGYAPVIEYCGGTEIGGGFLSGTRLHPARASAFTTPSLGARVVLLASDSSGAQHPHPHRPTAAPATGELALLPPMLGTSQRLLNKDHGKVYYAGMPSLAPGGLPLRRHGDEMSRLPGACYRALGRVDDTMNLGGIKVSSVELERAVVERVPGVAEAAAVGVPTPGGGPEQLHLFIVLAPAAGGSSSSSNGSSAVSADVAHLKQACQEAIRKQLNPLFKVESVRVVSSLPRTASNKVMRRVLRDGLMQPAAKM